MADYDFNPLAESIVKALVIFPVIGVGVGIFIGWMIWS